MSKVILKKLSLPSSLDADRKIQLMVAHINDLENNLEILLNEIKNKMKEEGSDVS